MQMAQQRQQHAIYRTGSRVEVSSEDEGFTGAWYTARVLAAPRASVSVSPSTPNSRKRKNDTFLVQYETLFEDENGDKFLTEFVRSDFVRPLPPPPGDLSEEEDFQLYDVVDAYHRDGWWRGVVTGVIDAAGDGSGSGGGVKYLVSFEYPPEEIEFGRSDLRFHLQWVNSKWVRPPKQIPEMAMVTPANGKSKAAMAPGSVVYKTSKRSKDDVSENPTLSDLISPIIKSKKRSKHKINETVACDSSRRKKTGVSRQSLVKRQKDGVDKGDAGPMNEIVVRDCATNENELDRLSGKGVSHQPQFSLGKEGSKLIADTGYFLSATRSHVKRCRNMKKMRLVSTRGERASQLWKNLLDDHQERNQSAIETPIKDSPEAPRGGSFQIVQVDPGKGADEIPISMFSGTCDEQLLLTWLQEMQPPTVIENSGVSHPCLEVSTPAAVVHGDSASKCQTTLSFVKSSPVWSNIESLEVFKKMPQKPHFAPLVEFKEDSREGFAIGHMVTFANVVEKTSKLQSSDEQSSIKRSLETLLDLKDYGFEVEAVQVRLERLLSMKDDISLLEGEWIVVDSEIMKHSLEISELEKEMNELEVELRRIQERLAMLAPIKKTKGETIADLRQKVGVISDRIKTTKLEFDQLAASPL